MAKKTNIAWAKSTLNFWIGCTKVSVSTAGHGGACDNCYAERLDARKVFEHKKHWGPGVPRYRTTEANWKEAYAWNRQSPQTSFGGHSGFWPVFVNSLSDFFDNEVPKEWRDEAWKIIRECSNLYFILLTKRIGNVPGMLPADWAGGYPNVQLGITVCDQFEANRDIPKLLAVPARYRWLSIEPQLGRIDLAAAFPGTALAGIHQVVCGGESGDYARPLHPDWVRTLRDECKTAAVPFFFKQWGEYIVPEDGAESCRVCGCTWNTACEADDGPCYWHKPRLCSACIGKRVPKGDRPVKYAFTEGTWSAVIDGRMHQEFAIQANDLKEAV